MAYVFDAKKIGVEPKIPSNLFNVLQISKEKAIKDISEEVIRANIKKLRKAISFWRYYPDILLDSLASPAEKFTFYFYQRIFLRVVMRHRYTYNVYPRAYSKSFLSVLALYLRCMLYPNSKLFIVSGGKEQAAKIATEKLEDIWKFFPSLRNEIIEGPGATTSKMQKDWIKLVFRNGSTLDIVAARQSARGGRRTSGLVEEVILVPSKEMNEVIIPLMNVSRRAACGVQDPNDITNKSQIYVTTAGYKGTFAYEKMIEILGWSVLRPWESMVLGGTWRIPVLEGLLDKDFSRTTRSSETYSPESFNREYESIWSGGNDGAYFSDKDFDNSRDLKVAMYNGPKKKEKNQLIIATYDVARYADGDNASLIFIDALKPGNTLYYEKNVRNVDNVVPKHFLRQSIMLKKECMSKRADKLIIDANGVGAGLVDFLTVVNVDPDTGIEYPPFGIDKESDSKGHYKEFYNTKNEFSGFVYLIKADPNFNNDMYKTLQSQMSSSRLHFLEAGINARGRLERTNNYKMMSLEEQEKIIKPYIMTDILRSELLNLYRKDEDSAKISLKRVSSGIKKDKVSALGMGIWYINELEKKGRTKRKKVDMSQLASYTSTGNIRRNIGERGGFSRNGFQKSRGT